MINESVKGNTYLLKSPQFYQYIKTFRNLNPSLTINCKINIIFMTTIIQTLDNQININCTLEIFSRFILN